MPLSSFFQRLREHRNSSAAANPKPDVTPAAPGTRQTGEPEAAAAALEGQSHDLAHALRELRSIHEALEPGDTSLRIPCEALLCKLPAELRGPAWQDNQFPAVELRVHRKELLAQLTGGRLLFPLSVFILDIPSGWIVAGAKLDTRVELDLAKVVPRIPRDWLQPRARTSAAPVEIATMADFFAPKAPVKAESRATEPAAPISPVAAAVGPADAVPGPVTQAARHAPPVAPPAAAATSLRATPADPPVPTAATPVSAAAPAIATRMPAVVVTRPGSPSVSAPVAPRGVVRLAVPKSAGAPPPGAPRPVSAPRMVPVTPIVPAAAPTPAPLSPPRPISVGAPQPSPATLPARPVAPGPLPPPPGAGAASDEIPDTPEFAPRVAEDVPDEETAPASGAPLWDGREARTDAGVNAVDINQASSEDLLRLAGVGPHVAEAILAHRQTHGPFACIFDLAGVDGVGPKLFRKMTGVSLTTRQDRHEVLNGLLGLEAGARPALATIAQRFSARMDGAGVVLSTLDGMPLAFSRQVADEAARYAAVVPQMFRRTRRYFRQLLETNVHCLALPTTQPMLLLIDAHVLFVVVALQPEQDFPAVMNQALAVSHELHWLLDARAVVMA